MSVVASDSAEKGSVVEKISKLKAVRQSVSVYETPPELGARKTAFSVTKSIFNQDEIENSNSSKKRSLTASISIAS